MLSRIAVLIHLGLVCLCLNSWFPGDCYAQGRRTAKPAVAPKPTKEPSQARPEPNWEVTDCRGWGQTEDEAAEYAASHSAREKVEKYLRERVTPPLPWTPSTKYVRDRLLKKESAKRCEEGDQKMDLGRGPEDVKCWTFTVAVGPRELEELRRQEADHRAELARQARARVATGRLDLATRVLAGLVVFLLALVGYIRLDEWTKGYYSRWLAAGLITMTLLGLGIIFVR
jgi:hypothetical protein